MSDYTFEKIVCPHVYFPNDPSRSAQRIVMKTADGTVIGWTDYFIENGWSKFVLFYIDPLHRSNESSMALITNGYGLVPEPKQTFWWQAAPMMKPYFDQISALRPDMTFAAGGAIRQVIHATE